MKTCPSCGTQVEDGTIKCECGATLPHKKKPKPLFSGSRPEIAAASEARPYGFLRVTCLLYKVLACLSVVVGFFRLLALGGLLGSSASSGADATAPVDLVAVVVTFVGAAVAFVTLMAVAQAIELAFEIRERIAVSKPAA